MSLQPKARKRPAPVEPLPSVIGVVQLQLPDRARQSLDRIIVQSGFVPLKPPLRHAQPVVRWEGVDYG